MPLPRRARASQTRSVTRMGRLRRVRRYCSSYSATLALVQRIARELHEQGTYHAFLDNAVPYAEANALFTHTSR